MAPFQVPPLQAEAFALADAHTEGRQALLKMSFSPVRSAPLTPTCLVPRAPSSVPRPVDFVHGCVDEPTRAELAARTFTRPDPRACELAWGSGTAVAVSAALAWSGVQAGCC